MFWATFRLRGCYVLATVLLHFDYGVFTFRLRVPNSAIRQFGNLTIWQFDNSAMCLFTGRWAVVRYKVTMLVRVGRLQITDMNCVCKK